MHIKKIKIFFLFIFFFQHFSFLNASEFKSGILTIKNKSLLFNVEISDTKEKRENGLMFITRLDDNK